MLRKTLSLVSAATLLASLLIAGTVASAAATTGGTFEWNGQNGLDALGSSACQDAAANGGTMLWIFTGKGENLSNVVFHWPGGTALPDLQGSGNGSYHFTVTFFDPTDPPGQSIYVSYDGTLEGHATLTISGCNEGGGPGTADISTTVHLGADDTGGTTVVDNTNTATAPVTVHDSGDLTFSVGALPGGSDVTFYFFENNDCTVPASDSAVEDVSGATTSPTLDPELVETDLAAGAYSYQAFFTSGNSGIVTDAAGVCEPFTLTEEQKAASADISTEIHMGADDTGGTTVAGSSVDLGSTVHDSATIVTNPVDVSIPDGSTVTFFFFDSIDCNGGDQSGAIDSTTPIAISGSTRTEDPALSESLLTAGSYSYMAVFTTGSSDVITSDTSDCEPLTVNTKDTSPSTTIVREDTNANVADGAVLPLGTAVHDTASIGGQVSGIPATGTVTYHFFVRSTESPACGGAYDTSGTFNGHTWSQTVNVNSDGTVPNSQSTGALPAGYYSFDAVYSGDDNYNGNTSPCEPFSIAMANTTTSTSVIRDSNGAAVAVGGNVPVGTAVHDTATVGTKVGSFAITGTVTYHFFYNATADPNCGSGYEIIGAYNGHTWPQTVTITGAGLVPNSQSTGALNTPGYYAFDAVYSGNANYNGSTSACEPFNVFNGALTPGYWKNHLANSAKSGSWTDSTCSSTTVKNDGGSCSTGGPWAKQYLPQTLGTYQITTIVGVANVFAGMNCSSTKDQDAIGCLAGHLLAAKFNVANGANTCINGTIANANAFLISINYVGPTGKYTLTAAQRTQAIAYKNALDKYNNGGGC